MVFSIKAMFFRREAGGMQYLDLEDYQEHLDIYRNFRSFTRTADYPHRPIIAYGEKKSQRITRTGG